MVTCLHSGFTQPHATPPPPLERSSPINTTCSIPRLLHSPYYSVAAAMINSVPFASSQKRNEPLASGDQTSTAKVLTTGAVGAAFLVLSGLTLTGTVMVLIFASPVVVLFSPILVPVGIVLFLAASGFVFSGGCAVAAITALTWLFKYASDHLAAKRRAQAYGPSFAQIGL